MKLKDHPTVVKYRERTAGKSRSDGAALESEKLRQTILAVGVDDVGFSSLDGHLAADEAEEISAMAVRQKGDLIVMTRRGAGILEGVLFGRIAEEVVKTAPVPVLLLPGNEA